MKYAKTELQSETAIKLKDSEAVFTQSSKTVVGTVFTQSSKTMVGTVFVSTFMIVLLIQLFVGDRRTNQPTEDTAYDFFGLKPMPFNSQS